MTSIALPESPETAIPTPAAPTASLDMVQRRLVNHLVGLSDNERRFIVELEGGMRADTKSWHVWDWPQGVGLYGLLKQAEFQQDVAIRAELVQWFERQRVCGLPSKNVNTMAPLLTLASLPELCGQAYWRTVLGEWAEWAMHELPRTEGGGFQHFVIDKPNTGELWDDTLMMTVLPLARIGLLLDRPAYVEEAKRQFFVHADYLVDRGSGLWMHGWTFEGRHHFAGAPWARGNSWITMAIPDFIELLQLPEGDATRLHLVSLLQAQVNGLDGCQHADGLWPTLLDEPDSYPESSATAGFAYGILKGVRMGLLPLRQQEMGLRAGQAVLDLVDANGALQQVSFGTPVFADRQSYRDVPLTPMPYGQAMAVLALGELQRAQQA